MPKKLLLDASYISDMFDFYPLKDPRFKFVWDCLLTEINQGEIIVIDKVYKELKDPKNLEKDGVRDILDKIKPKVQPSNERDNIVVIQKYDSHRAKFKKVSFDRFARQTSADLSLICYANKVRANILTNEILTDRDRHGRKKLNIPSLAELLEVKCFELRYSITKIIS